MKRNVFLSISGLVCLIYLWACTVGPDFQATELYSNKDIEKSLDLQPSTKNTEKSYLIFNDKILNQLISMAVQHSPSVKQAIAAVKQARLAVQISDVQGLPTLDAAAQYNYVKESQNIGYVLNQDVYQVGLDASWELDIFGSVRRRQEAALASAFMTIANLENVYVSLISQVASSYVSLRQAQSLDNLLNQQLQKQKSILIQTQSLWQAGLLSQDVVNTANIDVQNILSKISANKLQLRYAENQLALLTGKLPNQINDFVKKEQNNIVDKKFPFDVMSLYDMSADVLENRPDVKSALYELVAQNAQIGVAVAELYPKVSLSGMLGFQSLHFDNLLKNKSYSYSVTPALSVPLFYFGQLKNKVKIEEEKYAQLFAKYEEAFLSAAQEIKDALIALQNAQKQYDVAEQSLFEMQNIYNLTMNKKNAGLINQIDLNKIQIQLLIAQQKYLTANVDLYESVIRFFKSIGVVS